MKEAQRERAARFRALHGGPSPLLLCNVWDAASARVVEEAGFPALATTSAGIAWSLGYADGEHAPFEEVVAAVRRIVRIAGVPVSADIETGFGESPSESAKSCLSILEAGAVGVNLEDGVDGRDGLVEAALHCERIRAAKDAAAGAGMDIFVNARTDGFLDSVGDPATRLEEAVRRCNAYRAAGADGLFVPGVSDEAMIERLVQEIDGPVNILAGPQSPPIATLARLGVARVSLGSGAARAGLGFLRRVARELAERGTYSAIASDAISYAEANNLFSPR